jgi:hypothetical protein
VKELATGGADLSSGDQEAWWSLDRDVLQSDQL